MKKIITLIMILICAVSLNAQNVLTTTLGYSSKNILIWDMGYQSKNDMYYLLNFGFSLPRNTDGENYSDVINWDEYPEDVRETGKYSTSMNFGIGKVFHKNFYATGLIGVILNTKYKNCYDNYHIFGDNGKYYITKSDGTLFNVGVETGVLIKYFTGGVFYMIHSGLGAKVGVRFEF